MQHPALLKISGLPSCPHSKPAAFLRWLTIFNRAALVLGIDVAACVDSACVDPTWVTGSLHGAFFGQEAHYSGQTGHLPSSLARSFA
jgi:hypothetical protein